MTVHVDFDLPANVVSSDELHLVQGFLAELLGEALRLTDHNEE